MDMDYKHALYKNAPKIIASGLVLLLELNNVYTYFHLFSFVV